MTIQYPTAIDNFASLPRVIDNVSPIRADDVNRLRDATIAVETELGVNPSGTFSTVRARLDALEESGGGGGGNGSGVILQNKGDLLTRDDSNEVALSAGTDGYVLVADSTQTVGLRWSASGPGGAGTVPDLLAEHIIDPDNREYFLSWSMPYGGVIEQITAISGAGTFTLAVNVNSVALSPTLSVSTVSSSQSYSTGNSFAIGNSISITLSGVDFSVAQDLKFTVRTVRDSFLGNLGEVNVGQNVGTLGVGVYKQKVQNILQFRDIASGSSKISVALDGNNNIVIDANQSAFTPTPPAGSNTQVQFNNSGTFGASSNLTYSAPALFVTGSDSSAIAIGNNSGLTHGGFSFPSIIVDVEDTTNGGNITIVAHGTFEGAFMGMRSRGTHASPTAIHANDPLVVFAGTGHDGTSFGASFTSMNIFAAENWTPAAQGTKISFDVTRNGTTTASSALLINHDKGIFIAPGTAVGTPDTQVGSGVLYFNGSTERLQLSNNTAAFSDIITRADTFSSSVAGLAPASGGGTLNFLRSDGTWTTPPSSGGGGSGANTALSNLTTTSINKDLLPALDDGYNLGSSALRWENYIGSRTIKLVNAIATDISEEVYSNTSSVHPTLSLKRAEGSSSAPAEVNANDVLGALDFYGYDGTNFVKSISIESDSIETWTTSARGTSLNIKTIGTGQTTQTSRLFINGSGQVGINTLVPSSQMHVKGDGYFESSVRILGTTATASTAGTGTVRWNGSIFQYSDGIDWRPFTTGNTKLLSILTQDSAINVVHFYCSALGNDITGDGTLSNPWRHPQRALDEVPNGAEGYVLVHLIGVGPFKAWTVRDYGNSSNELQFLIIGDQQNAPDETWTLSTGSLPSNPSGGTKHGVYEYNVGAYSTVISEGSHWLDYTYTSDPQTTWGFIPDGYASHSPKLRISNWFELVGVGFTGPIHLRPVITQIIGQSDASPTFGALNNVNNSDLSNPYVVAIGLRFTNLFMYVHNTSFKACVFDNSTMLFIEPTNREISTVSVNGTSYYVYGAINSYLRGIWGPGTSVEVIGPTVETFMTGVIRSFDGSDVAVYVGGATGGRAPTSTALEVEYLDIEAGPGTSTGFEISAGHVRFGNHTPVSVDGITRLFKITRGGGSVQVVRINGGTLGIPCIFHDGSQGLGFGNVGPSGNSLTNLLNPGQDVTVGNAGTVAFTDLPMTDLAECVRVS